MTDVDTISADPSRDAHGAVTRPARDPRPGSQDDRWPDWLSSTCLALATLVVVASAVPGLRHYFARPDDVVSILLLPVLPNLTYAALLVVLAVGLRRRMRSAWRAFLLLLVLLPALGRVRDVLLGERVVLNVIGLVGTVVFLVLAFHAGRQFPARSPRASGLRALLLFVAGALAVTALGAKLLIASGAITDVSAAWEAMSDVLAGDLGFFGSDATRHAHWWVRLVIGLMGALVVLGSAVVWLRAPRSARRLSAADEARVRTLARQFGDEDSLGYFATRRDKAVVWDTGDASTAHAGVSYRVVGAVSLASGNPVGDPLHWPAAIDAWRADARAHGWSLAVMAAGAAGARAYGDAGLTAYQIGDEAILGLTDFQLVDPALKPVRQAVQRLRRRGYVAQVRTHAQLEPADFDRLAASAARWRGDGGDERGFSMALGRLGDPLDGECVLVEAFDAEGTLRGFLSLVPWGRGGLSLDLMRRDPTADNGIVELLVTTIAEQAPRLQARRLSLNFAMFREAFTRGEELGAGPLARLARGALLLASRTWQLESLYRSNAKYQPTWQPRYICFEYTSDLPRVGLAAGSAEGFLTRPSIRTLLTRPRSADPAALTQAAQDYADAVLALIPAEPDAVEQIIAARALPDQERVRRAKLDALTAAGVEAYPVGYPRSATVAQVRTDAAGVDALGTDPVSVTGRVMRKRDHGGLCFLWLRDGSGDLQVMASRDRLGADQHRLFRALDLGDHVGVTGPVVRTRSGELTVDAHSFALTSKSLRPLPDKRHGLVDPEARVRMRYVDLIVRPRAREVAYVRSTVVRSIRESLQARGFVEVETPILQLVHGGANARPFRTHINAYDLDLSLRIATELHLKRLVVGGMEQVFELGRQFRNEGADSSHNPEFTSLEVYGTYGDYTTMRVLTQELIQEAAVAVFGAPVARRQQPDGRIEEVDLSGTWPAVPICTAVSNALGEEVTPDTPSHVLLAHAARLGLELDPASSWGAVLEEVYGELCESRTTLPVFYTDFPRDTSPLTRAHRDDPRLVEKWDLVMWASEQGTAYSELIDPVDQRARLVEQSLAAAAGDTEAMEVDEDFLRAMEYGMPPTGGMGLGVDRLVMNLTGLGIRDTILFPIVRPS
ncbi:bifunctional lysylphosphatidylglycerol synthetase/lysine--tRNA ligase LysX [Cellulomonas citrea]|uniref:bifunctional lysylphosphatidylglycerol synthetase/lysine--tRNA ligase LysX n=1 Tax=Cellulomonas citrea TaxID=1909423 RepID=UPI00135B6EB9|nr:bifunctional lysylphosphatidylglycerol synthetase/lysine--tRNA ligase LysX [Cellulomonas citrea]